MWTARLGGEKSERPSPAEILAGDDTARENPASAQLDIDEDETVAGLDTETP